MFRTVTLAWSLLILTIAPPAVRADVKLPGGKTIPDPAISCYGGQPGGLAAIFACACDQPGVCNIGDPCPGGSTSCDPGQNGTCEARIWHEVNDDPCIPTHHEGLDPIADATVKPETFKPVCGHTFTLLTRGGAMFKNGFGWYNVTSGAPDPADLHLLVDCNTPPGTKTSFDLLSNPDYKGGEIGFFLVTPEDHQQPGSCASGDCCATLARVLAGEGRIFYSQPALNPDNDGSGQYVHLLMYNSKLDAHTFYFTWEDTFAGSSTDYSDFVTSVSGIACAGAGERCDTGDPGVCGLGVTKCSPSGELICASSLEAEPEVCDGLDNDCNGEIDDGATCPGDKQCYQGSCVGSCAASLEFPCAIGYVCDEQSELCVDEACVGVTCAAGEICRDGGCGDGCAGVVCPAGQICQAGLCVDPCANRLCGAGEICKLGVCLPDCTQCGGLTCTGGLVCDNQTGDCYDPSCGSPCPAGSHCDAGQCVGACHGVVCPGGVACVDGQCPPPGVGAKDPTSPTTDPGGDDWTDDPAAQDPTDPDGDGERPFYVEQGCSCSAGGDLGGLPPVALALLLLGALALHRRRGSGR